MADTIFVDGSTTIVAAWLNDVNDFVYTTGATKDGAETLTNKTLTAPAINGATILTAAKVTSSSATGGVGYETGAGGTVTQATSKSTGVTLNKLCGEITMHNASLSAGAEVSFTVTNSSIAAGDVVVVNHASAGTAGSYAVHAHSLGVGSFAIMVGNMTSGSLAEAIVLRFVIIKGATA